MVRIKTDDEVTAILAGFLYHGIAEVLREVRTERFEFLTDPAVDPDTVLPREVQQLGIGRVYNFFGRRGAGKTSCCMEFVKQFPGRLHYIPEVMVNRTPRPDEEPGIHFIPWDEARFWTALNNGDFLVAYRSGPKLAGLLKQSVAAMLEEKYKLLLIVNLPGYCVLERFFPGVQSFLIDPPLEDYQYFRRKRGLPPLTPEELDDPSMGMYGPFTFVNEPHIPRLIRVTNPRWQWGSLLQRAHPVIVTKPSAPKADCAEEHEGSVGDALLYTPRSGLDCEIEE